MKKNVIGHMTVSRTSSKTRLRRLDLFPRILCLLLAFLIWLTVANVNDTSKDNTKASGGAPAEEQVQ